MDAVALLGPLAKVRDNVIVTRETQYFARSGTFVAPADGIAIFRVLGAGGSGASSGRSTPGSGGNGGSVGVKRLRVKAGDTYAVTIPAGGAARNQNASGVAGENGGTLTIVGPGASISVPGGRGGGIGLENEFVRLRAGGKHKTHKGQCSAELGAEVCHRGLLCVTKI